MPNLATDIEQLRDRHLHVLVDLHDDYVHTSRAWRSLLVQSRYGLTTNIANPMTLSVIGETELPGQARTSIQRMRHRCFKDLVGQFELFVAELIRLWLPHRTDLIEQKALTVATLLACSDLQMAKNMAVQEAVESTIIQKMYDKPERWLNYLRHNLGARTIASDEASFVEMKARRDVLEHHAGLVDSGYREKAKGAAKYNLGDRLQLLGKDVDETYLLVRNLISNVANSVATALSVKPQTLSGSIEGDS